MRVPNRLGDEEPLPAIKYVKGMPSPRELVCPDKRVSLNKWIDIMAAVADWLVGKKYLDESHCPVPMGSENAILNTKPVHQNGKPFKNKRRVGELYLNTNIGPASTLKYASKLIETAGLEPSDFKAYFEVPNHPDLGPTT